MNKLKEIIDNDPPITSMMTKPQIYGVLYYLDKVLSNNIEGDIVELGCNVGTTSIYIQNI